MRGQPRVRPCDEAKVHREESGIYYLGGKTVVAGGGLSALGDCDCRIWRHGSRQNDRMKRSGTAETESMAAIKKFLNPRTPTNKKSIVTDAGQCESASEVCVCV